MTEIQALLLIKSILESADIHGIENILAEDCEYMSTGRGIIGRNRNESIEFLSSMTESIKADNVPVTCKVMHITDVYEEDALFHEGRHGLTVSYESGDNYVYMIFVDVNDEGLVDRIVSSQENYSIEYDDLRFGDDESEYAFISAPTTVKDWITALSMWLETANVDVDDFYQYIDEDTRVVFQKLKVKTHRRLRLPVFNLLNQQVQHPLLILIPHFTYLFIQSRFPPVIPTFDTLWRW